MEKFFADKAPSPGIDEKHARRDEVWMMREVDDEDVDAMSQVTRGARSGFAPRGRFARGEEGPHWFHRLVAERVARFIT
jgi:hypothetical protein